MSSLEKARALAAAGQFQDALQTLGSASVSRDLRLASEVLHAELLERTGRYKRAKEQASAVLNARNASETHKWSCHLTLGRISCEEGRFDEAVTHLQRATSLALIDKQFQRAAWAQLRLLILLFDASGPEAVGPLLADLRANATRSGDPHIWAALHLHVGEMESKRGLLASAERQLGVAQRILDDAPNTWLEAMAEQNLANLACLRFEFNQGIEHAQRAAMLAARSGWAAGSAASAVTLGNLLLFTGRFEEAAENCYRALDGFIQGSDNFSGTLETLARIRLCQGNISKCDELLRQIDAYASSSETIDGDLYTGTRC
jgi:tetratricopeptide (TPR) repeat protein